MAPKGKKKPAVSSDKYYKYQNDPNRQAAAAYNSMQPQVQGTVGGNLYPILGEPEKGRPVLPQKQDADLPAVPKSPTSAKPANQTIALHSKSLRNRLKGTLNCLLICILLCVGFRFGEWLVGEVNSSISALFAALVCGFLVAGCGYLGLTSAPLLKTFIIFGGIGAACQCVCIVFYLLMIGLNMLTYDVISLGFEFIATLLGCVCLLVLVRGVLLANEYLPAIAEVKQSLPMVQLQSVHVQP